MRRSTAGLSEATFLRRINRRGHDILSIRASRATEGAAALQTNKEGIADNKYAASWMAERGFPKPVIGHDGMLTVKHASTPAMVLLSARDGVRRVSHVGEVSADRTRSPSANVDVFWPDAVTTRP